jgi:hypothetical protein
MGDLVLVFPNPDALGQETENYEHLNYSECYEIFSKGMNIFDASNDYELGDNTLILLAFCNVLKMV